MKDLESGVEGWGVKISQNLDCLAFRGQNIEFLNSWLFPQKDMNFHFIQLHVLQIWQNSPWLRKEICEHTQMVSRHLGQNPIMNFAVPFLKIIILFVLCRAKFLSDFRAVFCVHQALILLYYESLKQNIQIQPPLSTNWHPSFFFRVEHFFDGLKGGFPQKFCLLFCLCLMTID